MSGPDPTRRFSDRVEHYRRHRPTYPRSLIVTLVREAGLAATDVVADIGSGTGRLSERFLANGNRVVGVEPDPAMRAAAEQTLGDDPRFRSVDGRAEATTLADRSVDVVAAGQAFHWFDVTAVRQEFSRILTPGGTVVLVWNGRRSSATPFMSRYEELVGHYARERHRVDHREALREHVPAFFAPRPFERRVLQHEQALDEPALIGRLLSSSYLPLDGEPGHAELLRDARALFARHQRDGRVVLLYHTLVFWGPAPASEG